MPRRLNSSLLLVAATLPIVVPAQGVVSLAAGAAPSAQIAPGAKLAVPISVDMSAATGTTNVAAIATAVSWGPSRLTLDSVKAGTFGTLTPNITGAGTGNATLSISNPTGTTATVTVATLFFTAAATAGGTQIMLAPASAGNAMGALITGLVAARSLDVAVMPSGKWGDVNGDNTVSIVDAQQIARYGVGLPVANLAAVLAQGDVTGDNAVNVIDAQQIARFSVGLPAAARVNTALFTVPAVASVTIAPAAPSVTAGAGIQLTGTPKDAGNNPLTGLASVTWASSDPTRATVNATGFVRGIAAGSATITASVGGRSAQVTVTVTAALSGAPAVAECATPKPGWIWCDDFETDRLSSYFEYANNGGRFVRAAGAGISGSVGMSAKYPTTPQSGPGALHLAFGLTPDPYFRPVDAGTAKYREIYWRLYVMHPTTWVGGGPDKMSRAIIFASSGWAEAISAHVWDGAAGDDHLYLDPASGTDDAGNLKTTVYNDFANFRWLGAAGSTTDIFDSAHLGQWTCVEAHVRLNDAGQSNGVFDLWINGNLEANRSSLNWVGSYSAYGINAVFFENYWNDGSPVEQTRYWDNIVVSTQRIGC